MELKKELLKNIKRIHTTELGVERIKRNLNLNTDNVIQYCVDIIKSEKSTVEMKGKNFYIIYEDITLTINKTSFTVITAHKK